MKKLQNIIITIFSGIITVILLIGLFCYKGIVLQIIIFFQVLFKGKIIKSFDYLINGFGMFFILLLFSNALYICKTIVVGEYTPTTIPYKAKEKEYYHLQTKNKEFEYHLWLRRDKQKQDLLTMEQKFAEFKQKNPQYKGLKLYHTHKYIDVRFWTFWKYYFYSPEITNKYDYFEIDE